MDKKPIENKTIKTIVPIKGNLLEKIKNKLKHNGSNTQTPEVNDALNNNNKQEPPIVPKIHSPKKLSKIQITKIEKVNLDFSNLISTNSGIIKTPQNVILKEDSVKATPTLPLKCTKNEPATTSCHVQVNPTQSKSKLPKDDEISSVEIKDPQNVPCTTKSFINDQPKKEDNVNKEEKVVKNNVSEEEEESECMDLGEEDWMHDISIMIGESRIREIDKGLKKIPTVVTGNSIQTENVELKLIINHLLGKLNAKSVTETLETPSFLSNTKDSTNDYTDSFDDLPTDSEEDISNILEKSTVKAEEEKDKKPKVEAEEEKDEKPTKEAEKGKDENKRDSFSIALENSVAVVTIPPISDVNDEPEEIKHQSSAVAEPTPVNKVEDAQPTKKRRAFPPLAASTAKKTKPSPSAGKLDNKKDELESFIVTEIPRKLSSRIASRASSVKSTKSTSSITNLQTNEDKKSEPESAMNKSEEIKKVTRVQELKLEKSFKLKSPESSLSSSDCDTDKKSKRNSYKKSRLKGESSQKITEFFTKKDSDSDKSKDTINTTEKNVKKSPKNGQTKSTRRKRKIMPIADSESDSENEKNLFRIQRELKSVASSDSNSQPPIQSSIIERYDYLNKSSSADVKNVITGQPICAELSQVVTTFKEHDPTYVKPPEITKRPYLKTSAFAGNHINSDSSSHTVDSGTTGQLASVSNDSLSKIDVESRAVNNEVEIKDKMKELIDTQKKKIQTKVQEEAPVTSDSNKKVLRQMTSKSEHEIKRMIKRELIGKKVFEQEKLEKSIEKLVCYPEIIESIRISDPPRKNGRASSMVKPLEQAKKAELEQKLKSLEYFKCGSCTYLVTKHKWKDHLESHGFIAWIDEFESPFDIADWNEAVRRCIQYMKIYKLEGFLCPNCNCIKKSAIGHLSHIITCGEDEDVIESRKVKCSYCDESVLPYNMSAHRRKCTTLNVTQTSTSKADEGDDEDDDDEDENSKNSTQSYSGRKRRKAGKKAVKNFKVFLKKLNDDPMDQVLVTASGKFICNYCTEKFNEKQKVIEHIEKRHADQKDGIDFDESSSDAKINENESSETDGSSGVESSDIQSANEDDDPHDSINVSNSNKGKQSNWDSQEVKNGRRIITTFADSYNNVKISQRTIKLTMELINDNLCDNVLTEYLPKYKINDKANLASYLSNSKYEFKSMKFVIKLSDTYGKEFGSKSIDKWMELDAGDNVADKNSLTLYCGGSVSSLDWSQASDGNNFLAVACNSAKNRDLNLEETSKSCIQVYQFEQLVNEKFSTFENTSKLLYFFSLNEGPVWCIKFHPFAMPNNERIGLLAVTTSNHIVYVFSLPYLKSKSDSLQIFLEPTFACKTIDGFCLYQDKYLMQATIATWMYRKENDLNLLGAGFINGMISVWNFNDIEETGRDETTTLLPYITFQPHREPITALDFKHMLGTEVYLMTAALDRAIKVYTINNSNFQEVTSHHGMSRILCAEFWVHWPGYICGYENSYAHGSLVYRQPNEFALRNMQLMFSVSSITACNLNHWLNFGVFSTEGGDVLSINPGQLLYTNPKDRWLSFGNNVISYTDLINVDPTNENTQRGIVFCDLKSKLARRPKEFRTPPSSDVVNQLQINQISFNRNEMSYRFYALGYETGFVRIRHLKNFK